VQVKQAEKVISIWTYEKTHDIQLYFSRNC